jgi:hypothetical protein
VLSSSFLSLFHFGNLFKKITALLIALCYCSEKIIEDSRAVWFRFNGLLWTFGFNCVLVLFGLVDADCWLLLLQLMVNAGTAGVALV